MTQLVVYGHQDYDQVQDMDLHFPTLSDTSFCFFKNHLQPLNHLIVIKIGHQNLQKGCAGHRFHTPFASRKNIHIKMILKL